MAKDLDKLKSNLQKANSKDFRKNGKWYTSQSGLSQSDINDLIEIHDHTDIILELFHQKLAKALEIIGLMAEGYAKRLCPVDTGRLRNSITHTSDGNSAYIGTNVEYAEPVEMGHGKVKARPYLRPAAQDHMKEYRDILEQTLSED